MAMDQVQYEEQRNVLIDQLQEIAKIQGLPEDTSNTLDRVSRKLKTNVFNIVLIGEFQGGKSTTFNAICDGREISPRGMMIKTSACKISAQNLPESDQSEYAALEWKSDEQLLLTIINLIAPTLRNLDPKRFESLSEAEMARQIDLSQPSERALVKQCLDEEWKMYKEDPAFYDIDGIGKLDLLRIGSLIVNFYDSPVIQDARKKTKITIPEMSQWVVFAKQWETRWLDCNAGVFQPEEVVFAFLGSVMCYLHSPNLARLGCVITDCPGLFASPWDTAVAQGAMLEADAILYLIGGEKAMSQGDVRALKEIRKTQQDFKLFFSVNAKVQRNLLQEHILPTDIATMRSAGFSDISAQNIYIFHALLGLCSKNGTPIKNGNLDEESLNRFVKIAQEVTGIDGDDPKQIWQQLVERQLTTFLPPAERASIKEITADPQRLGDASGLESLLDVIEKTVILKKARALLVDGGCHPINVALQLLENELEAKEKLAAETVATFEAKAKHEKDLLETFSKEAKSDIDTIMEPRYGEALAQDFLDNVIVANSDEFADQISEKFADNVLSFKNIFKALNKEALKGKLEPLVKEATENVITPRCTGWLQGIADGTNERFNYSIGQKKSDIVRDMQRKWVDLGIDADSLLLGGLSSVITESPIAPTDIDPTGKVDFEQLKKMAMGGRAKMILTVVMAIVLGVVGGIVVTILIDILLIVVFEVILGAIPAILFVLAGAVFGLKVSDRIKKKVKATFQGKLRTDLRASFTDPEVRGRLLSAGREIAVKFQEACRNDLNEILLQQKEIFEKRYQKAKIDFAKSNEERQKIAAECYKMRTEQIEPAHKWSEDYEVRIIDMVG